MNKELKEMRNSLQEIAEREATKLYRLAWRMQDHGCLSANIQKCRQEAHELHMTGYPERLLDPFRVWNYAFKF